MKINNRIMLLVLFFCVFIKFMFAFPLDNTQLPGGVDTSSHLFKVWYLVKYGITKWNYYWYSGFAFITHYPPLSHLITAELGNFIGYLLAYKLMNNILISLTPLIFFIFLKNFNLKKEEIIVALIFFSFMPIYSYYLADGRFPALFNLAFSLLYWISLKKAIENKGIKYIFLTGIFLSLSILIHHLTTLIIVIVTFFWAIFYRLDFGLKEILNTFKIFSLIVLVAFLLSSWWTVPYFIEMIESYNAKIVKYQNPIDLPVGLYQSISKKYFTFSLAPDILIIFIIMSIIFILISFFDWKNKITRDFIIVTIFAVIILLIITYKRAFLFIPIPLSIVVTKGIFKLKENIRKIIIPIFILLTIISYLSIKPLSYPFPEFPNIPKDGRVLFLPISDGFQENENEVKGFYSVMLSPMYGNENAYGWHIESQQVGEAGQKKTQYYDLLSQPFSLNESEYYNLLKSGWINYVAINKKEEKLISFFNKNENFHIFNETNKFIIFEIKPKSTYIEINGESTYANISKLNDLIIIESSCKQGKITIKESYHKNWICTVNDKKVNIEPSEHGFIDINTDEKNQCIIKLSFEDPWYYSIFNALSILSCIFIGVYLLLENKIFFNKIRK